MKSYLNHAYKRGMAEINVLSAFGSNLCYQHVDIYHDRITNRTLTYLKNVDSPSEIKTSGIVRTHSMKCQHDYRLLSNLSSAFFQLCEFQSALKCSV